jgi:hypothetical protein
MGISQAVKEGEWPYGQGRNHRNAGEFFRIWDFGFGISLQIFSDFLK